MVVSFNIVSFLAIPVAILLISKRPPRARFLHQEKGLLHIWPQQRTGINHLRRRLFPLQRLSLAGETLPIEKSIVRFYSLYSQKVVY
jgi:hypothetical protein